MRKGYIEFILVVSLRNCCCSSGLGLTSLWSGVLFGYQDFLLKGQLASVRFLEAEVLQMMMGHALNTFVSFA